MVHQVRLLSRWESKADTFLFFIDSMKEDRKKAFSWRKIKCFFLHFYGCFHPEYNLLPLKL